MTWPLTSCSPRRAALSLIVALITYAAPPGRAVRIPPVLIIGGVASVLKGSFRKWPDFFHGFCGKPGAIAENRPALRLPFAAGSFPFFTPYPRGISIGYFRSISLCPVAPFAAARCKHGCPPDLSRPASTD